MLRIEINWGYSWTNEQKKAYNQFENEGAKKDLFKNFAYDPLDTELIVIGDQNKVKQLADKYNIDISLVDYSLKELADITGQEKDELKKYIEVEKQN